MKRYPFAPLAKEMGLSEHQATVALGLSGSTAQEYRKRGVTEQVADRLAGKAGLPTLSVWPEMVDDRVAEVERACEICGGMYQPKAAHQKYCSRPCQVRAQNSAESGKAAKRRWSQRQRQSPEVREAEREYARRYREAMSPAARSASLARAKERDAAASPERKAAKRAYQRQWMAARRAKQGAST